MEEILASIRRIISEEGDARPAAAERRAAPAAAPARAPAPPPASEPAASEEDVLELSSSARQPAPPPQTQAQPYRYVAQPQSPSPQTERRPSPSTGEDELMSAGAAGVAAASFAALAGGSGVPHGLPPLPLGEGGRTLEELVRETLRPLLKAWLDQNLPPLVERMVRVEIERLSRRG